MPAAVSRGRGEGERGALKMLGKSAGSSPSRDGSTLIPPENSNSLSLSRSAGAGCDSSAPTMQQTEVSQVGRNSIVPCPLGATQEHGRGDGWTGAIPPPPPASGPLPLPPPQYAQRQNATSHPQDSHLKMNPPALGGHQPGNQTEATHAIPHPQPCPPTPTSPTSPSPSCSFDRNVILFTPAPSVAPPSRPAPDPWRFKTKLGLQT
uniref:Uncharacterized protein n=2 Tax=Chromera velia CCMP2878 TaxID=1169474 RepID=A0A0K6S843_9ALVE|eukprot:Cvel_23991.t2-p1 / transcript=Cvel_23991.t2 / gene=Cvel_23991 / organism=Chromera_velia_CCMP2878 / gene_product=hypothetical protein / transcript_product=hypothetical protein / location=Cvel_scaffold2542:26430-27044(-) / protein_length=205 / sequence_SO=supercontig / SO=protein_coding / is_pseudo=false